MAKFFETNKPKQFKYKPRFYDEEKERVDELLRRAEKEKSTNDEMRRKIIEGFERQRKIKSTKSPMKSMRLIIYLLLLILLILILLKK